mmetsp:Transcript_18128/g.24941  ORF Transcript_18128/g.24941 Transcript_18128/m.24941 type:complete len:229 (-) Transcript_18128:216-902(-)|eukprot:CAMPEP_0185729530 /NCGR_PEP_ID=MMETSP1171-20130828/6305_1 /TAXON_ID=374046 /ORGANISM="Helicotheca tamensis, Strain CCMP826" /LENGTH=228 /DNA_ID=CAMNT_0028398397 /DNA_START=23 /DNA_END=709 /DNA_ORIENTATION=-
MTASASNNNSMETTIENTVPSIKVENKTVDVSEESKPAWAEKEIKTWGERLRVAEWEDAEYRTNNGWKGTDLIHSQNSPVQINDYMVSYGEGAGPISGLQRGGTGTMLTGVCYFSPAAESHKGFCHGGSMTSVLDDVIGWCGFLVTGECRPWSGFTAQVNASLKRPIAVGSTLRIRATVTKWEGRKVYISAELADPCGEELVIHAIGEGLVILQRDVLSEIGEEKKSS